MGKKLLGYSLLLFLLSAIAGCTLFFEPTLDENLDQSVSNAIIKNYFGIDQARSDVPAIELGYTESHIILGTKKSDDLITVYAMMRFMHFSYEGDTYYLASDGQNPVALTFQKESENYKLVEFWQPTDGEGCLSSMKEKLPKYIINRVHVTESNKYSQRLSDECEEKVRDYLSSRQEP